jgi:REP element-mobilizing transposase RayT
MVIAYHVIYGMYGFWLPNDPRGSWSDFVGSRDLYRYGPATKVDDYRSYAHDPHDRAKRLEAKGALKYPPVVLTGRQALSIAKGFANVARASGYKIYACTILPEHGHLVLGRHHYKVEQVVRRLKQGRANNWRQTGCTVPGSRRAPRRAAGSVCRELLALLHRQPRLRALRDPVRGAQR